MSACTVLLDGKRALSRTFAGRLAGACHDGRLSRQVVKRDP